MLTMTSGATQAIERILSDHDVPDSAGLRIESAGSRQSSNGAQPEADALRIVIASEAPGGDQVVEQEGVRVFIDPTVSDMLDDKLLDIAPDGGGVTFTIVEQP